MSSPAQSPTENEPVGMQSSTRDRSASVDVAPGGLPRDHRSSSLVNPSVQVEQSPAMLPPQPLALRNILKGFSQDSGRETQGPSREESIDKEPSSSDVSSPKSESPTESPTEGQDDSTSSSEKSTQNSSNETTVPSVSIPFSSDDSSTGPKDDFSDDSATVRYTTPHPIAKCQIVKPDRLAQITDQPGFTPDTTTMGSLVNPVSAVGTMTNVPDVTIDPTITSAEQRTLGDTDSVPTRAVKAQLPPPSKPKISEWFEAMFTIGKYGGFLAAIVQFITIFFGLWLDTSFKRSDTYMCTLFLVSVGVLVCVICGTFEEKGQIEWCSVAFILDAPLHIIFFVEHQTPAVWWAYPGVVCAICLSLRVSTGILCKPEDYYMKVLNYHWQQRHHEIVKPTFRNRATSTGNLEAAEAGSSMGASSLPLGETRTISRGPSRGDGRPDSRADSQATSRNVSRMDSRVASRGPSEAIIHEASTSNSSSSENEAVIEAEAEVEPLRKGDEDN